MVEDVGEVGDAAGTEGLTSVVNTVQEEAEGVGLIKEIHANSGAITTGDSRGGVDPVTIQPSGWGRGRCMENGTCEKRISCGRLEKEDLGWSGQVAS